MISIGPLTLTATHSLILGLISVNEFTPNCKPHKPYFLLAEED
jgi:hypothetical protein